MWLRVLAILLFAVPVRGAEILHIETDAVRQALTDSTAHIGDAEYFRYAWTPSGDAGDAAAVSFALNTAWSKASTIQVPDVLPGGRLIRIDMRRYFPKDADLRTALRQWDKLAEFDTAFYARVYEATQPYRAEDGKTYSHRWRVAFGTQCGVYQGPDKPPDMGECTSLGVVSKTATPILSADRLVVKSLSQLNGGMYYELAGVRKSQVAGRTDFEQFLLDNKVDPKLVKETPAAPRRIAIFKSGVTGKPRAAEDIQGLLGEVVYTNDVADDNIDPKAHPVLTLLQPKFDAIEAIAIRANGTCVFALFNGKGELQDVVPDNIARDHTIPSPYTSRLQPAISCIRCHATGKGFRTIRNDVLALLDANAEGGLRLDILGDKRFANDREFIDILAVQFQGKLDRLDNARNQYSDACFLATGGMSVEVIAGHVQRIHDSFQFSDITPQRACLACGVKVDEAEALDMLRTLVPARTAPGGREDARVGFLKAGIAITNQDFEAIRGDVLIRSRASYYKLAGEGKK